MFRESELRASRVGLEPGAQKVPGRGLLRIVPRQDNADNHEGLLTYAGSAALIGLTRQGVQEAICLVLYRQRRWLQRHGYSFVPGSG